MSDFVDKPLSKRMNMGNPISRIERVERAVGPAPSASVESLSDLSTETGIIRGDLIIAPASGVETEEVTSTDFTGVFMSGDAKTFNGEDWNFGGVNAGVLQAGFNSLTGKFVAGAGAVTADENGVGIQSNSSGSVAQINSLSFLNGSAIYAYLASYFDSTSNVTSLSTRSISGKNSSLFLEAVSPSGNDSIASLRAQTGTGSNALLRITAPNGGQVAIESNALQEDVDTNVYGVSSTPAFRIKASTNSPYINGDPAWIPIQKLTTETRSSDGATLANDTDLQIVVVAGKKYNIRGKIFFDTTAAADFKYRFIGPSTTPTLFRAVISHIVPGTAARVTSVETALPTTTNAVTGGGTTMGYIEIDAIHHNDSDSVFRLQWAQNTSTAANTSVLAGSYLEYCILE